MSCAQAVAVISAVRDKFFGGQPNVAGDLAEQRRGDVSSLVHRNGRAASIGVAILHMRTALANVHETEAFEDAADFGRFEDGKRPHDQAIATF